MFESVAEIICSGDDDVLGGSCGHVDAVGEPGDGVCNSFSASGGDPYTVLPVVVHGGTKIPGFRVVRRPGVATFKRSFMNEDLHAWWSQGRGIVIEWSVELGIG